MTQNLTGPLKLRKCPCYCLHRESLRFFSYFFFLLSPFILSLGPLFHGYCLTRLSSTSYITAAFRLVSGHPGLEIKIYITVLYTLLSLLLSRQVMSISLLPHGLQHTRLPCPSPTPRVCPSLSPSSWWCHPTISTSALSSHSAFNLSQHQGLFQWVGCSLTIQYTKVQPRVEDAHMWQWQCTPDMWTNRWLDTRMHTGIFESLQLEGTYVGDSLYWIS